VGVRTATAVTGSRRMKSGWAEGARGVGGVGHIVRGRTRSYVRPAGSDAGCALIFTGGLAPGGVVGHAQRRASWRSEA